MSSKLIEGGGTFIDYRNPNKIFKTTNIQEWEKHLKETKATYSGTAPCAICSNPTEFENITYGTKPVCDSCKKEVAKK